MNEQQDRNDEVLRERLAAADPAEGVSIDPIPNHLMEHIVNTTTSTPDHTDSPTAAAPRRRWRFTALGGAAPAAVSAVIDVATLGGGNDPVTASPLELTASGGDAMASCLPFSVDILDDMVIALEGTVTAVDGPTVTLEIDRWYRDGTESAAETVVVNAPEGMEALIGGVAFEKGGRYLISADADGNVAYCGYTAPATDDMRASFEQAFPG
jgi:hypothetical protein